MKPSKRDDTLFSPRTLLLIVFVLASLYACSRLFVRSVSIHENQEIFDALMDFTPGEGTKVKATFSPPGDRPHENKIIEITDVSEQTAVMAVLKQLTNDGYLLRSDANFVDRFFLGEAFPYQSFFDIPSRYYQVTLFPAEGSCVASVILCEDLSLEWYSRNYFLKYGNTAPAISYFDTLFGVTASS